MKFRSTFLSGLSLLAVATATSAVAQQRVGTAGAVNPATTATRGTASRTVDMGSDVIFRERIATSASGSLQVTFVDKSTLSIGPNSQLIIDEFVYDPNAQSGRTAISLTRGAMRFVGGQISKSGNVAIKTPTATIGVRGGVAMIFQTPQGTQVTNLFGRTTVTTAGGTEVISRPGFGVEIVNGNQPPPTPTRVTQAQLDDANKQLTSRTAQTGGSKTPPTDTTATLNDLGRTNAMTEPRNTIPQQQASTSTNGPRVLSSSPQFLNQQPVIQNATAGTAASQRIKPDVGPPPPPPPPPPLTYQPRTYALVSAGGAPYLMGNFITNGAVIVTPAYGYRNGGEGTAGSRTRFGTAALSINGQGANQRSTLAGATGTFISDGTPGGSRFTGGFVAASRQSAGQGAGFSNGNLTSVPGSIALNNDALPTQMVLNQNRYVPSNGQIVPDLATQHLGGSSPTTTYGYQIPVAGGPAPSPVGGNRTGGEWQGYAAGTMQSFSIDSNGNATANGDPSIILGSTQLQFNPNRSTGSGLIAFAEATGNAFNSLVGGLFQFGENSTDATAPARSAYIDRNNWVMREQVSRNGNTVTGNSSAIEYQSSESFSSGENVRPSDPSRPNRMLIVPWSTFEAQDSATARSFFPTITQWHNYEYSQWGFWAGEMNYTSSDGSRQQLRTGNLNTWVAGQPTDIATMPTTGSGTYTGQAIANIVSGSSEYVAGGNFSHTVDFGARTGTFAINNLDGHNYTGASSFGANSVNFYGGLTGPSSTGAFSGSFYGPNAIETGGSFMFRSTGEALYMGSGIFIGRR